MIEENKSLNSYEFIGIKGKKKQQLIINLLNYCKEIRDTAYPLENSLVTELLLTDFIARKEKDIIYVTGNLLLADGERNEKRYFEAYITENQGRYRIYLDISRLTVTDEPKMIRTTEELEEEDNDIISLTAYQSGESTENKTFSSKFPKVDFTKLKVQQLKVL